MVVTKFQTQRLPQIPYEHLHLIALLMGMPVHFVPGRAPEHMGNSTCFEYPASAMLGFVRDKSLCVFRARYGIMRNFYGELAVLHIIQE